MVGRSISIFILLICLAIPLQTIRASSDKSYTTIRLNKFGSVVIVLGTTFGFDIGGLITPFFTKLGDIAIPNFKPTADWLSGAKGFISPYEYNTDGKHISWDANANPIFYTALYGAILKTDAEHSNHPPPSDCIISTGNEKSSDVEDAPRDFQNAREYDAWLGVNPVDPNDSGIIDFNLPSLQLAGMNGSEDCKKHQPGFEQPPVENDIRAFSQFGGPGTVIEGQEMTTIMKIIEFFDRKTGEVTTKEVPETEPHKDDVILTKNVKQPYHSIQCHHGGCPPNESGKFSGNAAVSGGWTAFLLREEDKKPFTPASVQPYEISIVGFPQKPGDFSYDLKNLSDRRTEQAACYVVPDTSNTTQGDAQAKAAVGGNKDRRIDPMCKPKVSKCPIDIIKEKFSGAQDASCKLCNQNSVLTHTNPEQAISFGSGLSQLGIKVLEAAADTYKVPAGVLLATMLHEGAFNPQNAWSWSSDGSIEQYSDCTNPMPMPNCTSPNDAVGPFGFIVDPWWNNYMENNKNPYDGKYHTSELEGMQDVVKEIPKENFSPCNFTDAAFMAARELSEDSSHVFETVPGSCTSTQYGTINFYQGTDIPQSCSSWSPERVATSRLQYAEGIDEGACSNTPEGIMVTNDIGRMVKMYGEMKCGGGMNHF